MSFLITLLEFILAFGFLVFLHELGHYLVAKALKIEVEEFGFGFPPRMLRLFKIGETDFTLNWIPFGAFVRPKGEEDPNATGGLMQASPWVRLAVALGGPMMNLATGILMFALLFSQIGIPRMNEVVITGISPESPAETAGLQTNDLIVKVNDQTVSSSDILLSEVNQNLGKEITLQVKRGDEVITSKLIPRVEPPEGQGPLGIAMGVPFEQASFIESIPMGFATTFEQARQLVLLPSMLIRGDVQPEQARFVGPKGVYDMFSQARERDVETPVPVETNVPVNTLSLLATLAVALGLTNLLPLPALDGGRILFTLPEIIFRKRVPAAWENRVHMIGFILLLVLMVFITVQDISNPIVMP